VTFRGPTLRPGNAVPVHLDFKFSSTRHQDLGMISQTVNQLRALLDNFSFLSQHKIHATPP
jgi:hypothetical protein